MSITKMTDTIQNINEEMIRTHYKALAHKHQTEIRVFDDDKYPLGKSLFVDNEEDFVRTVKRLNIDEKCNVYVGYNERKLDSKEDENVISCRFIPIDVDTEDEKDLNKVEAKLFELKLKYQYKIHTGAKYRYHYYIPIPEITDNEKIKEILAKAKRIFTQEYKLPVDKKIYNPERVLRVWGTVNYKHPIIT